MNIKSLPFFMNKEILVYDNLYAEDNYHACFLVFDSNTYYKVRLASRFNLFSVMREYRAIDFLTKRGFEVGTEIIDANIDGDPMTHYIITTYIPGTSLDKLSAADLSRYMPLLVDKLSRYLLNIHELKDNCFHNFCNSSYNSYFSMLLSHLSKHIDSLEFFDAKYANLLKSEILKLFIERESLFHTISPSFLHSDFKAKNIVLCKENHFVKLIDFEHSRFGDPLHEFARSRVRAYDNQIFNELLDNLEHHYMQQRKSIYHPIKYLLYMIYCNISELPYLYSTDDFPSITKTQMKIETLMRDLITS